MHPQHRNLVMHLVSQAKKGNRIRKGSPQEEAALADHIAALAPSPTRLTDAGALTELLVLLGREADSRELQRLLSQLQTEQQVRVWRRNLVNENSIELCCMSHRSCSMPDTTLLSSLHRLRPSTCGSIPLPRQ